MKKVVIAGASGMVGGHLLDLCLNSKEIGQVVSLVRRVSGKTDPKLTELIVSDFTTYDLGASWLKDIDIVFFCIGVYTGAASRDEFRKITVDYPVALAKAVYGKSPEATFCLLSGSGADRSEKSRMMFAKDKGAAENRLAAIGFKAFRSFRPGYIYPVIPRKEPNFSYKLSRSLYPVLKLLKKNFSIKSTELAQGIFNVGLKVGDLEILENADILKRLDS